MGRKPRIEYEGALYHVIHRGNNREYIFENPEDKLFFLGEINEIKATTGIVILGYVVMSNHYHLILRTEKTLLSGVMHKINSAYGRYYNRKYERTGHVFEGRYKSILITDEKYLLAVLRYIHNNPVKAGIVQRMEHYKWSSDEYYRNNHSRFVDIDIVLNIISDDRRRAIKQYIEFMEIDDSLDIELEDIEMVGEVTEEIHQKLAPQLKPTLDDILHSTGANEMEIELIKSGSRMRRLTPYKVKYIKLAKREGYSSKEIARHINSTTSAISNLLSRNMSRG